MRKLQKKKKDGIAFKKKKTNTYGLMGAPKRD